MAMRVLFPKVGANVTEGAVGVWYKREGEAVAEGEPLVEIVTSKATFDVESPVEGVLRKVLAPSKSVLPVGYILCIVGSADEVLPDVSEENKERLAESRAATVDAPAAKQALRATPGARRLARELGVDLAAAVPSGGGGVIREADVRRIAGGE